MVDDARYRTRDYLEGWTNASTALNSANLTKDDDSTQVSWITCFGDPPYPMTRVFMDCDIDLVFNVGEPNSTPLMDCDQAAYGYEEHVPITVFCVDKPGITGTKLKWKAEAELRRICENYPTGSLRGLERRRDNDQRVGSMILYSTEYVLNYRRDTT